MSFCPHVCIWQSNWAIHYVWNIYCYRVNNLTNKKSCWSFDQSEGNGVVFCGTFRGLEFHRLRRTGSWLICSEKMTEDDNKNTFFKTWFEFFSFLFNAFQWDSLQKMSHSAFSARQWKLFLLTTTFAKCVLFDIYDFLAWYQVMFRVNVRTNQNA